jgi:ABC-type glutathione transport system ATPase component
MSEALRVEHLSVYYPMRSGVFSRVSGYLKAVDDVSFELSTGEILAVIGESGCGKSTLAQALVGLLPWNGGKYAVFGQNVDVSSPKAFAAVRKNVQMVFQDPYSSLNPRQTVSQILTFPAKANGLSESLALSRAREKLDLVGLPSGSLERFPHEFSGGQRQRIGIARALMLEPKVLIADEVTSALDVSVQAQVLKLLDALRQNLGISILFISHDILTVRSFANRVMVLYKGHVKESGPVESVLENPKHPYTRALMASVPTLDFDRPPQVSLNVNFDV